MEQKIKTYLDNFITEKYDNLIDIAKIFISTNNGTPEELITETYLSISKSKSNGIKKAIDNDSLWSYFYVAMRNQLYYYKSNYNKQTPLTIKEFEPTTTDQEYKPTDNQILFIVIKQQLHQMYQEKIINHYEYNLFNLIYSNEDIIPIHDMETKEVNRRRKMSLRSLSKELDIPVSTIFETNKKTLALLKNRLIKNNIL